MVKGIHHVTAIAGDPQRNLDFYTKRMQLRLVKVTINFDDPETYHLYYADQTGTPGTVLTFFPYPGGRQGRPGTGQTTAVAFAIGEGHLDEWRGKLEDLDHEPFERFGRKGFAFHDPDGMLVEMIESGDLEYPHFHSVTLTEDDEQPTARLLEGPFGMSRGGEEGARKRYVFSDGACVDMLVEPESAVGRVALGSVHHVAYRVPDDGAQLQKRDDLAGMGLNVTSVIDRCYFKSIYFREPGGALFEVATYGPGFMVDESEAELGSGLRLPPWLESRRAEIEASLPPLSF